LHDPVKLTRPKVAIGKPDQRIALPHSIANRPIIVRRRQRCCWSKPRRQYTD
jgi:hypothetical protein